MNHLKRRQVLINFLDHHGPLTIRDLGRATGIDINTINTDLKALELDARVDREEIEGWRANRGSCQNQFRWRLA